MIDYNWLKAEYMKKPEEMDKTGEECWFNRFFRLSIMLKFKFSKVMIGFTEDDPFKVQDKRVPEPSVSVQAPRGKGEDGIWGTMVTVHFLCSMLSPN